MGFEMKCLLSALGSDVVCCPTDYAFQTLPSKIVLVRCLK